MPPQRYQVEKRKTRIPGNELADQLAREAAAGSLTNHSQMETKYPVTFALARISNYTKGTWTDQWRRDTHGRTAHHLEGTPRPTVLERYNRLSRPMSSAII